MKLSLAVATTAALLLVLEPARATTIYPISPCRVYVDTDYTGIAAQCGTVVRWHSRRLFVQASRRPLYYRGP
jgi:hypothetical protein